MNTKKLIVRFALVIGLGCLFLLPSFHARAGGGGAPAEIPAIIQNGFNAWTKNRQASWAFDVWKIGGALERDSKPTALSRYLSTLEQTLGNFKNFEAIETKRVSQNSEVIYLAVNCEHALIYGRFLMYRTDADWVVQNMDFSPRPEALMPWLSFEGGTYTQ